MKFDEMIFWLEQGKITKQVKEAIKARKRNKLIKHKGNRKTYRVVGFGEVTFIEKG